MSERLPGALVISLDFELLWGLRDRPEAEATLGPRLRGAREAVPDLLELFQEFQVAATWATVGFLFARSRAELEEVSPTLRPEYVDRTLDPYGEQTGTDESDDPLRFASSLIERIGNTPGQEIASHTFSHYYCGEPGQSVEAFRADLEAAREIAGRRGYELRSIVFPRNQIDARYLDALSEVGIRCFRGNPDSMSWSFSDSSTGRRPWRRLARLVDMYGGRSSGTVRWNSVLQPSGLCDVRASCFLAPYRPAFGALEGLRLKRFVDRLRAAAREGALMHLWWHPHNFGDHREENLGFLRAILEEFARCREEYGMRSMSMLEVDDLARRTFSPALENRNGSR